METEPCHIRLGNGSFALEDGIFTNVDWLVLFMKVLYPS